jgi:protein subunit release factor A
MSSSFGATTILSSRWLHFLPMFVWGASTRPAAAFAFHPVRIAHHQEYQLQQQQQQQQQILRNFHSFHSTVLSAASNKDDQNEIVPTWEYVPYDPKTKTPQKPNNNKKNVLNWTVPKHLSIPEDRVEINFVRSSGSGGQNVNKLSTKVELRLDLKTRQPWMPAEVQRRLKEQQSNKISKEGILTITAQEHRTQGMNRKSATDKLRKMVLDAWPRPKIRKQRKGISKAAKARNKEFKKRRSDTKQNRKRVDW